MSDAMHPETEMMSFGYIPAWSEGAIKCPIFQTSTFVFESAEKGKEFFEVQTGKRPATGSPGLIYSRMNNPDVEILENRLKLWDGAAAACAFESGMAAISTVFLSLLEPGDLILHTSPLYGATHFFVKSYLKKFGIDSVAYWPDQTDAEIHAILEATGKAKRLRMAFVETPANPTNALYDISQARRIIDSYTEGGIVAVDNTYMGPLWQHPLKHGADLSIYSATKYIGGHSDLVAGAVCGGASHIAMIRKLRSHLGSMAGPWTGWLLLRSLETLKVRMEQQARNAEVVADYLKSHPKVERLYYLGNLTGEQHRIYQSQYSSAGAMLSFDLRGGEAECFRFLNALKVVKLAVSLGSTESLAEHPYSMTHAAIPQAEQIRMGITDKMIRFSVGLEHPEDIIRDVGRALEAC